MYYVSCRDRPRGRGIVPVHPVLGSPNPAVVAGDHWTVLVHGFNNSLESAGAIWDHTIAELALADADLEPAVCFFWPGDYSRWKIVSAMNYPRTVPIAEATAKQLTDYLVLAAKARSGLQLRFVAHSLGALVVLETCRLLRAQRARIKVTDILLMAAAVPEGFCVGGQLYGRPFSSKSHEKVMYSGDDDVLKWFFQIGQEVAKRFPVERRRAVGRFGGPGTGVGQRWDAGEHKDGFGHGSYWKDKSSIAEISRLLNPRGGKTRPRVRADPLQEAKLPTDELSFDSMPGEIILHWLARGSRLY